jgi:hypothetical protein
MRYPQYSLDTTHYQLKLGRAVIAQTLLARLMMTPTSKLERKWD